MGPNPPSVPAQLMTNPVIVACDIFIFHIFITEGITQHYLLEVTHLNWSKCIKCLRFQTQISFIHASGVSTLKGHTHSL